MNEVIRAVLNFLFLFFTIRFHMYKKAQNVIKTIQFFNRSGTGFLHWEPDCYTFAFLFSLLFKFYISQIYGCMAVVVRFLLSFSIKLFLSFKKYVSNVWRIL